MKPFRFFADAAYGLRSAPELIEHARRAEALGYDGLLVGDHLGKLHAAGPALAVIAAATERLRVGSFVFNNDLRHPTVLAHDLASLDILSEGRLEIGIGAGWNRQEYDPTGLRFDPAPVRQARLAESITVLKGSFGEGPFSFEGTHYTITEYDGQPKPVQRPHPRLMIGGGARRTLELAAREANLVGLAPRWLSGGRRDPRSITIAATEEKVAWVREAAGPRFEDLELNTYPAVARARITDHARAEAKTVVDRLSSSTGIELSVEDVLDSPHVFLGTVETLVEKVVALRQRLGINVIQLAELDEMAPVVERLAGT